MHFIMLRYFSLFRHYLHVSVFFFFPNLHHNPVFVLNSKALSTGSYWNCHLTFCDEKKNSIIVLCHSVKFIVLELLNIHTINKIEY